MIWEPAVAALFSSHVRVAIDNLVIGTVSVTAMMVVAFFGGKAWESRYGPSTMFNFNSAKSFSVAGAIVTVFFLMVFAVTTWA